MLKFHRDGRKKTAERKGASKRRKCTNSTEIDHGRKK
jgi:hypothetical protein